MTLVTFAQVNFVAVVVAAAAYFALGAVWYSPPVFARPWMRASGVTPGEGQSPAPLFVLSFAANFLAAAALAFLARASGALSVGDGVILGLSAALGFSLTSLIVTQAFEGRPAALQLINTGYHVVGIVIAAIIVTVWD